MTSPTAANLDVDPEGLAGAGRGVGEQGEALAAAVGTLSAALSSGAQPGHDAAGAAFAMAYLRNGQAALSAAEAAVNACRNVGFGIGMSATNYSRAEAASTPGGGSALPAPPAAGTFAAPGLPSPYGPGVAEPILWRVVEAFVGDVWPDGEPDQLRAAAAAWETFGAAISSSSADIERAFGTLVCHTIPERDAMLAALRTMADDCLGIGSQCNTIAGQLRAFAGEVETSQQAIRDILHRLSPSGLLSGIAGLLRGENPWDDIKAAAKDIQAILHNMKRQADGNRDIFEKGMGLLDTLVSNAETLIRKDFVDWFGEDVGNPAATAVNSIIDIDTGIAKDALNTVHGLEQLASTNPAVDPQRARDNLKGLVEGAGLFVPPLLAERLMNDHDRTVAQLKGLIHYDDWNSDHPLRGLGGNLFDVGTVFLPGGAGVAGRTGTAARVEGEAGAAAARGAAKDGAGVAAHAASSTEVAAQSSKLADDLNAVKLPEAQVPAAQPGPSVLPESRAPVDSSPSHDPAPTNAPSSRPLEPEPPHPPEPHPSRSAEPPPIGTAESTPHASPHTGDHLSPAPHEPGARHSPVHETPATREHAPSVAEIKELPSTENSPHVPTAADDSPPPPAPHDSSLFDGYDPVEPGPQFTTADGSLVYPDDMLPGKPYAVPGSVVPNVELPAGTEIGRFGYPGGAYMAPEGTPFAELSLPPGSAEKPYYQYVVNDPSALPPGWSVEQSEVAAWFHQPGGGTQYRVLDGLGNSGNIVELLLSGFLRRVN